MTRSAHDGTPRWRPGHTPPRIEWVPAGAPHPDGRAAVELAAAAGLILDPWQERVLLNSLRRRPDGKWAAFEVGLVCPRQNGKNSIIEARQLAGMFVLGERLQIHSAHQFDTSLEAFRRLKFLIEENDWLAREVKRISQSHGEEGIELKSGQRIRFRTRTKGGGRGFSGDVVYFDESMILPEATMGAILPVVSARPNPQVWYTGSAVDQTIHEHGFTLTRIRERGRGGDDPSLFYSEWSADAATPEDLEDDSDPLLWAQANPALNVRIAEEHVANERRSMDPRTFAVERLGVGDWPDLGDGGTVIPLAQWEALTDAASAIAGAPVFAFDVTPDRAFASIAAAGARGDGVQHGETVDRRRGTGWIPERLAELVRKHQPALVLCDASGPAGSLLHDLQRLGVTVKTVTAGEHAQACGLLYDLVVEGRFHHLGSPELSAAIRGAEKRPLGDAWAWSRKNSATDISPLVALTLATWGATNAAPEVFAFAW